MPKTHTEPVPNAGDINTAIENLRVTATDVEDALADVQSDIEERFTDYADGAADPLTNTKHLAYDAPDAWFFYYPESSPWTTIRQYALDTDNADLIVACRTAHELAAKRLGPFTDHDSEWSLEGGHVLAVAKPELVTQALQFRDHYDARLLELGLSVSEALDYRRTRVQRVSTSDWASVRGVVAEAVRKNARNASDSLSEQGARIHPPTYR